METFAASRSSGEIVTVALSFSLSHQGRMAASLPYPALHATHGGIWIAWGDGRTEAVGRGQAIARAAETPMVMLKGVGR